MTIEWLPLKDYEDVYLISNIGIVKSIAKTHITNGKKRPVPEKVITPRIDKRSGYPVVKLTKGQKYGTQFVHRLLATTYIPKPDNKACVNHKNGIKTDNRLENLEWCTYSENTIHACKIGLSKLPEPVKKKVVDSCSGIVYKSIEEAATALGINYKTCQHYLHGRLTNPTCLQFAA